MLQRPWQATAGRPRRGNRNNPGDLVAPGKEGAEGGDVIPDKCVTGAGSFTLTLRDQR